MAQIRQSRPDSGLGFQVKFVNPLKFFPLRSKAGRRFQGPRTRLQREREGGRERERARGDQAQTVGAGEGGAMFRLEEVGGAFGSSSAPGASGGG